MVVNGGEFFDNKGSWPVAFTMWKYKGKDATLDRERNIPLQDFTWLTRKQLASIQWSDSLEVETACKAISDHPLAKQIEVGQERISIRKWTGETRLDFMRSRRKNELTQNSVGGLPLGDRRQKNKKAYGEADGEFIGFMDDLTPCRVKRPIQNKPWFRLNSQFMDAKEKPLLFRTTYTLWLLRERFGIGQKAVFLVLPCSDFSSTSVSHVGRFR